MKQSIKNVVLVHGAFADGSGWKSVADILKNEGFNVSVAQPPETSYADDQKYTKAAIDAMGGPVVLVGHSYGGSIITEAGNHPNVAALVYIAAFALDEGESCASIEQAVPQASKAFKPDSNGLWWIDKAHFVADFAADIPRDEAEFMAISQVPISTDSFTHAVKNPAWKHKPTWYMVATEDRSINPEQERMMAKRAKARTVEVKSSHVAYLSHPKETAKLIEEAAAHVSGQSVKLATWRENRSLTFTPRHKADGRLNDRRRCEREAILAPTHGSADRQRFVSREFIQEQKCGRSNRHQISGWDVSALTIFHGLPPYPHPW